MRVLALLLCALAAFPSYAHRGRGGIPTGGGGGATQVFNCSTFTTTSGACQVKTAYEAAVVGGALSPAYTSSGHAAGGIWWPTQQNISGGFDTTFTFQTTSGGSASSPQSRTLTFVVQNSTLAAQYPSCGDSSNYGINSAGDANMGGYGAYNLTSQCPIPNSIGIKFDFEPVNGASGGGTFFAVTPTAIGHTGLYANFGPLGALLPTQDMTNSGINLFSANPLTAHVVYDGTNLTLTLTDTGTGSSYRTTWQVNIPAVIGSSTAWIGFTEGLAPSVIVAALVNSWQFSTGYNTRLASATISPAAGQYASSQSVTISCPAGASAYYTINGNQPTPNSTAYSGAITVSANEIVQAICTRSNYTDSLVATAYYQIQSSSSPFINFSSGFSGASTLVQQNGGCLISGSNLEVTSTTNTNLSQGSSCWFSAPVTISTFHTYFTWASTTAGQYGNGIAFCVQNPNAINTNATQQWASGGANAIGPLSLWGFGGTTNNTGGQTSELLNSVCVALDSYNNEVGFYVNGVGSETALSGGVTFQTTHPLNVEVYNNGTTVALTITDSVNSDTYTQSWTQSVTSAVGASTAFVGFTGSTGGAASIQSITSWTVAS